MERVYEPTMCLERFLERWKDPKCPSRSVGAKVDALFGINVWVDPEVFSPGAMHQSRRFESHARQ